MTTIIRHTMIDATPAAAWSALRDFGGLHRRLAAGFVTDCTLDAPDVRTVRFRNGAVAKERLIGVDDDARRLAYSVIESGLGLAHHHSAVQIVDEADGTRFLWTTDVLPDAVAPTVAALMDAALAAIRSTLERGPAGLTT
ncbi:MAG: SRPBCC family protein [Pseudonocardia sp.]|nr:SRPBCC family protein [Pseudonocardia sp.]